MAQLLSWLQAEKLRRDLGRLQLDLVQGVLSDAFGELSLGSVRGRKSRGVFLEVLLSCFHLLKKRGNKLCPVVIGSL